MPSAIDPLVPPQGAATTLAVRDNFAAAKQEIESLQQLNLNLWIEIAALYVAINRHELIDVDLFIEHPYHPGTPTRYAEIAVYDVNIIALEAVTMAYVGENFLFPEWDKSSEEAFIVNCSSFEGGFIAKIFCMTGPVYGNYSFAYHR